jgi:hypothetical protein
VETHFPGLLFSTLRYVVPDEEDQNRRAPETTHRVGM